MSDEFDDATDPQAARAVRPPPTDRTRRQRLRALPRLVAKAYADAAAPLKVRLLECLLQPVGPLAMVAIAAGAFRQLLAQDGWRTRVPIEAALRISGEQMAELVRYVEQASPDVLDQLGAVLAADNRVGITTLSSSLLLLALRRWRVGDARRR